MQTVQLAQAKLWLAVANQETLRLAEANKNIEIPGDLRRRIRVQKINWFLVNSELMSIAKCVVVFACDYLINIVLPDSHLEATHTVVSFCPTVIILTF